MPSSSVIAAVLCGGEGSRLRPLTYYFQKAMIPVGSEQRPLLEYIVRLLKMHGIRDFVFLVNYKYEQILNYFGDGSRFGAHVEYLVDRSDRRGTGWAVLNAYENGLFEDYDNVLIYYGDILSNIDLTDMLSFHLDYGAAATVAVSKGYRLPVGVADIKGSRIVRFEEKPLVDVSVCIGIALFRKTALKKLYGEFKDSTELDIMSDLVPRLIELGMPVNAYITECFWYDIGSTEKYEKLDNSLVDRIFREIVTPLETGSV